MVQRVVGVAYVCKTRCTPSTADSILAQVTETRVVPQVQLTARVSVSCASIESAVLGVRTARFAHISSTSNTLYHKYSYPGLTRFGANRAVPEVRTYTSACARACRAKVRRTCGTTGVATKCACIECAVLGVKQSCVQRNISNNP